MKDSNDEGAADRARARLLVIEDEPEILYVLVRVLEEAGYETQGIDTTQLPDRRPLGFDLVLVDGTSFAWLGASLSTESLGCPLVVMSGGTMHTMRGGGGAPGVTEWLEKPFDEETLLAVVARHTGVRR